MSEYMPKVGDRVRATLGENVLVGAVTEMGGEITTDRWVTLDVFAKDNTDDYFIWFSDGWRFEQVVELPTRIGAIIRMSDGALWVRRDRETFPWVPLEGLFAEISDRTAFDSGFTLLFEGVDE